jgi:hypothetical protein
MLLGDHQAVGQQKESSHWLSVLAGCGTRTWRHQSERHSSMWRATSGSLAAALKEPGFSSYAAAYLGSGSFSSTLPCKQLDASASTAAVRPAPTYRK